MPVFNIRAREVGVKIVYVGPGLGGKTTNIEKLHEKLPDNTVSELRVVKTEQDRTLFFDNFSLELPQINGMRTKISVYGVPGQAHYRATRKAVLAGVDGVVFVADSQAIRRDDNLDSFEDMRGLMAEYGYDYRKIPLVLQFNKRDLDDLMTVEQMNALLNDGVYPFFEAVAVQGVGVAETFKAVTKLVTVKLRENLERRRSG
jgi:signal recognition particle receptor subunit beta